MLTFELEIEEANTVLVALGARPFTEVAHLITKLQTQAQDQLSVAPESKEE